MIDLNTRVVLFAGHITSPMTVPPEWAGTLGEFWHENEGAYESFAAFQAGLAAPGYMYLGGGAEPEFTLYNMEHLDSLVENTAADIYELLIAEGKGKH